MSTPWTALDKFIAQRESAYVVEPLARTFLLGVAAGTLVEVGHIMYKVRRTPTAAAGITLASSGFSSCAVLPENEEFFVWGAVLGATDRRGHRASAASVPERRGSIFTFILRGSRGGLVSLVVLGLSDRDIPGHPGPSVSVRVCN